MHNPQLLEIASELATIDDLDLRNMGAGHRPGKRHLETEPIDSWIREMSHDDVTIIDRDDRHRRAEEEVAMTFEPVEIEVLLDTTAEEVDPDLHLLLEDLSDIAARVLVEEASMTMMRSRCLDERHGMCPMYN